MANTDEATQMTQRNESGIIIVNLLIQTVQCGVSSVHTNLSPGQICAPAVIENFSERGCS